MIRKPVLWFLMATFIAAPALAEGTKIAVINLSKVSAGYKLTKDIESKFEQRMAEMKRDGENRRKAIEVAQQELQAFKPGTEDFERRKQKLTEMEIAFQVWGSSMDERLRSLRKEWVFRVYDDIRKAAEKVAKSKGVDIVLTREEIKADSAPDGLALQQVIAIERVLWASDSLDITDDVIKLTNEEYPGPDSIKLSDASSALPVSEKQRQEEEALAASDSTNESSASNASVNPATETLVASAE